MYRPISPQPSGLLQQQPQRYSDRHLQHTISSGMSPPRRPRATVTAAGPESASHAGDATQPSKHGDDHGIKSYLKKTEPTDPTRAVKPDANQQVEEQKKAEKDSL